MGQGKVKTRIRREQIARAAIDVVASHGLAGLSVARVARRVGIVPSAIYRHYRGKEQVLDAALDEIGRRLAANVAAVRRESADPLLRLRGLLARHIGLIRKHHGIPRIVFSEAFGGGRRRERLRGIVEGYLAEIADLVREGQEQGRVRRDVDPPAVSVVFLGMIQSPAILWHLTGGRFDLDRQMEEALRIFSAAIGAPARGPRRSSGAARPATAARRRETR